MKLLIKNRYFQLLLLINCVPIFRALLKQQSTLYSPLTEIDDYSDYRSLLNHDTSSEGMGTCSILEPYALMLKEIFEYYPNSSLQDKMIYLINTEDVGMIAGVRNLQHSFELIINDRFLSNFSLDEIKSILAHELGHISLDHTSHINFWLNAIYINFYINLSHFYTMIVGRCLHYTRYLRTDNNFTTIFMHSGLFLVATIGLMILIASHSRFQEFQADAESLKFHPNPESLISVFSKTMNMTTRSFSLFDTHPSDEERILALRNKL